MLLVYMNEPSHWNDKSISNNTLCVTIIFVEVMSDRSSLKMHLKHDSTFMSIVIKILNSKIQKIRVLSLSSNKDC